MIVKYLMSCAACLVVGFAAGWAAPREAVTNEPEFVTSGEVYDSQVAMLDLAGRLKSCRESCCVDSIPAADIRIKCDLSDAVVSLHRWGLRHSR